MHPCVRLSWARDSCIRLLCEASAHREGTPQTDAFTHPTVFRISLNGVRVYQQILPDHPHDARGALSYLRGARGAYGYLAHPTVEGALLEEVRARAEGNLLRLRCTVPENVTARGGCTIYGGRSGRYPIPLTLILE